MEETPLRKDAEINRRRLLQAGREVFASRGLDATLNDVAHHAGVGVGTAYRRFANKEQLIDALFEQHLCALENILHEALAKEDAWNGLVYYLEQTLTLQAGDRAMAQMLSGRRVTPEQHDSERDRLAPLVDALADKAREQGAIRAEITGTDLIFAQIGIAAIAEVTRDGETQPGRKDSETLYRRYLWLFIDGLRPVHTEPLPVAALTTSQTHAVLAHHR